MCGYCDRRLEPRHLERLGVVYECPACAPELREVKTLDAWATWARRKARAVRAT